MFTVEAQWTTEAGLPALVIMLDRGWRCGYVGVGPGHHHYKDPYQAELFMDVHGGVTFSELADHFPGPPDTWWFGFDCIHRGDASAPGSNTPFPNGIFRSKEFCIAECEKLAAQLTTPPKE